MLKAQKDIGTYLLRINDSSKPDTGLNIDAAGCEMNNFESNIIAYLEAAGIVAVGCHGCKHLPGGFEAKLAINQ